jgi:glycosyltransferase involved in cell wall biosynthesis
MSMKSGKKPLVTVLITAYNEADYIEGAVRSVLGQTYDNLEAVVVNDGSTDGTEGVLTRRFEDERLRVFDQGRNGRVTSLNHGLDAAKGTFVAVLDADDRCRPRRIERQVDYLLAHGEVGVVGSQYIRKDDVRGEEYVRKYPTRDGPIRREMAKYIPISHSCAMYRKRAVVEAGGYDEALSDHEDLDLWIRLAQDWTLANIPEPLVVRHIRDDSYWHRNFSPHARNVHLAKLNARAVSAFSLSFYHYAFPLARLAYSWLPDAAKRATRRLLSNIEEQDLADRPQIPSS